MDGDVERRWPVLAATMVLVAIAVGVSVQLRIVDAQSSPVLPAEDTYTHTALVREHLRDGRLDSLNPQGVMYPPGLHAFIAAGYAYSGIGLYDLMRFGTIVFGPIGVLGIALLLLRYEGPVAAVVGAFGYAVAPELVFRTTMMAPTAADLAILPFYLFAFVRVFEGKLGWAAPAAVMSLFFVFAHPWVLTVVAIAGAAFLPLARLLPWTRDRGRALSPLGTSVAIAVVGTSLGLSLTGCGGVCGPGFRDIIEDGERLAVFGPLVAAISLVPLFLALAMPRSLAWLQVERSADAPLKAAWPAGVALLLAVVVLVRIAVDRGLPDHVDLVLMFGRLLLGLSLLGLLFCALRPGPASHLAAALALTTLPFVVFNPLDSPFWPHRTAAYLGVGLIVIAAVGAAALARVALRIWTAHLGKARATPMALAVPLLLVTTALAGSIYATTPRSYLWYRLYTPCEHEALSRVADNATAAPNGIVVTGAWQSKLVIAALTDNASRIWFSSDFFTKESDRRGIQSMAGKDRPIWVVVDKHLHNVTPKAETDFLDDPPWREVARSCTETPQGQNVTVYQIGGT